jgi:hypothetical protein|tara:strand:+ start:1320 stop:1547 length:228 start_codon:yes stop_codon:yes gene_type:complete
MIDYVCPLCLKVRPVGYYACRDCYDYIRNVDGLNCKRLFDNGSDPMNNRQIVESALKDAGIARDEAVFIVKMGSM